MDGWMVARSSISKARSALGYHTPSVFFLQKKKKKECEAMDGAGIARSIGAVLLSFSN
jgi:hypothetical protein